MVWSFFVPCSEFWTSILFIPTPPWIMACSQVPLLFTSAWSPLSGGLCPYACCQELAGVCYSLLVPPASGLAIQRWNSIWKLSWFFPLVFPVFSSLSVYYDFVTGENRINSKRKGHEVRLSEGFVSSERERQEVKAHSPGRKDWCVSDQCRPLCWNGDSGRVDRGRKKEPLQLKAKKKQTLS